MKKKTKRLIKDLKRGRKLDKYFFDVSENEKTAWMDAALEFARQIAWMQFEINLNEQNQKYPPKKV